MLVLTLPAKKRVSWSHESA